MNHKEITASSDFAHAKDASSADEQPRSVAALNLEELVDQHYDYLYRYAYRYFRSEDKALDVVQETYLAASSALTRFQGNSSPRTWLTSILRYKIADFIRARSREDVIDFSALEKDPLGDTFDAGGHWRDETAPSGWLTATDRSVERKQFLSVLEQCLSKLPGRMRQIFLLRELDECGRDEICRQLGLTSTNVGVILHRARLSLQQCLQSNWLASAAEAD